MSATIVRSIGTATAGAPRPSWWISTPKRRPRHWPRYSIESWTPR